MKSVLALFICMNLGATSPWTKADTQAEIVNGVLGGIDWLQTSSIHRIPGETEMNPVEGRHPSQRTINNWFVLNFIAHPLIAYALPAPWRTRFQATTAFVEVFCVANNFGAGLSIHF